MRIGWCERLLGPGCESGVCNTMFDFDCSRGMLLSLEFHGYRAVNGRDRGGVGRERDCVGRDKDCVCRDKDCVGTVNGGVLANGVFHAVPEAQLLPNVEV